MKICVYGNDLTAWVAAACLAQAGNEVSIHEGTPGKALKPVETIKVISNEPGLTELVLSQLNSGRLSRQNDAQPCSADIHWLALKPSETSLAQSILQNLQNTPQSKLLIINQSNFGVGETDKLQNLLTDSDQAAVYIPDLIQEGNAINGFAKPKRIIIGAAQEWAITLTNALLRPFSQQTENQQVMAPKEAEFTKFAITGMLAIRLGYINELANLADQIDVDIDIIRQGMGADPRIGNYYMSPGCGFGGLNFQEYTAKFSELFEQNANPSLLSTVIRENEIQKELLFRKLWQHYNCNLKGKTITLWGASFKPETASIDNAPSIKIIQALLAQDVTVQLHDPQALENIRQHFADADKLVLCDNRYTALKNSDGLLVVTEWQEYWSPDYQLIRSQMRSPLIIDGRNIFDRELLQEQGFTYMGIGR